MLNMRQITLHGHVMGAKRSRTDAGLTLIEALISLSLLGALISFSGYLVSQLLYNSQISIKQKQVVEWGRIDYLLETDIREGLDGAVGANPYGSCGTTVTTPIIAIKTDYSEAPVLYYNSSNGSTPTIKRCGPAILLNGALSPDLNTDTTVSEGTTISAKLVGSDSDLIEYKVTFASLDIIETGSARLRSRSY